MEYVMYPVRLTCMTDGCEAYGVPVEMVAVENDDGQILAICGVCSQTITDMEVVS